MQKKSHKKNVTTYMCFGIWDCILSTKYPKPCSHLNQYKTKPKQLQINLVYR